MFIFLSKLKAAGFSPILIDFFVKNLESSFLKKEHLQEIIGKKLINPTSIKAIADIRKTHEFKPLSLLQLVILDHFYSNDYETFSKELTWQSTALNTLPEEEQLKIAEKLVAGKDFVRNFTEENPSPARGHSEQDLFRYESIGVGLSDLNFTHAGHKTSLILSLPQTEGYFAENLILESAGKTISEKAFAILVAGQINLANAEAGSTAPNHANEETEESIPLENQETQTIAQRRNKPEWQAFKQGLTTDWFMFKYHAQPEIIASDKGLTEKELGEKMSLGFGGTSLPHYQSWINRLKILTWELFRTQFNFKETIANPEIWQLIQPNSVYYNEKLPVYEKVIQKLIRKKFPKEVIDMILTDLQEMLETRKILPGVTFMSFISAWVDAHSKDHRSESARKKISEKLNISQAEYDSATQNELFQELLLFNPDLKPAKPFKTILEIKDETDKSDEDESHISEINPDSANDQQHGNSSSHTPAGTSGEQNTEKEATQWTYFKLFINELLNAIGMSEDLNYFDEARKALPSFIERHGLDDKDIRINTKHIGGMLYNLGFTLRDLINNHFNYEKAYDDFAKRPKTYQLAAGKSKRSALREIFGKSGLSVDYLDSLEKSFMKPVTEYLPSLIVNAYPAVCEVLKDVNASQWLDALTSNERDEAKVSAALGIKIPPEIFQELIVSTDLSQLARVFPKQTNKVLKAFKENHASSSMVAQILFPDKSPSEAQIEINKTIYGNEKIEKQLELLIEKEIENINKLFRIDVDLSLSIDHQQALILHRLSLVYGLRKPDSSHEYFTPQLIKDLRTARHEEDPFDFEGTLIVSLLHFIKDIQAENQKVTARNLSIQINQWLKESQLTLSETTINQLINNAHLSEKIHLEESKTELAVEKPIAPAVEFDDEAKKADLIKKIMIKNQWSVVKAIQDDHLAHLDNTNQLLELLLVLGLTDEYENQNMKTSKRIIAECKNSFKTLIYYLKHEKSYINELQISKALSEMVEDKLLELSSFISGKKTEMKISEDKVLKDEVFKHLPTLYFNDHQKDINSLLIAKLLDIETPDAVWVYTHYYLDLPLVDVRGMDSLTTINQHLLKEAKRNYPKWGTIGQLTEADLINGWPYYLLEGKGIVESAPPKTGVVSNAEWKELIKNNPLLAESLRLQMEELALSYLEKKPIDLIKKLATSDNALWNLFKAYFPYYSELRKKILEFSNSKLNGITTDMAEKQHGLSKFHLSWIANNFKY